MKGKRLQMGYFVVTCNRFERLQIKNITYCFIKYKILTLVLKLIVTSLQRGE